MIKVEALHFAYGSKKVLDGIDFALPPRTLTVLCGTNGCGKSTLLKALCRLIKPDSGGITLAGEDISGMSRRKLAQLAAYMGQNPGTGDNFTVEELAALGRYAAGKSGTDAAVITEALELAGAASLRHRRVGTLSGGEKQRAFLALALAQKTPILLLDEPFSALDPAGVRELAAMLTELKKAREISIVMVLHDINLALRCADIMVGIQGGRTLFCAPPESAAGKLPELFALPQSVLQRSCEGTVNFMPW